MTAIFTTELMPFFDIVKENLRRMYVHYILVMGSNLFQIKMQMNNITYSGQLSETGENLIV
jgi:hypothetical protein